ncbi:MAG: acylphosphatase [Bacteroidia bacterium]|nr:acylphosphatase [Bacteroidia bacterium]
MRGITIIIHGRVQGVFYRASTQRQADLLGVRGTVRNLPDNTVFVEAEGEAETIEQFLLWCSNGPPGASVSGMDIHEAPLKNFDAFVVIH